MKRLLLILLTFSLIGCNDSDHFSYKRLDGSVHYKLKVVGDESNSVREADHLTLHLLVIDGEDTTAVKQFSRINNKTSVFPGYLRKLLDQSNAGDQLSILGSAGELELNALLGIDSADSEGAKVIQLEMSILEAYTDEQLRTVQARERLKRDIELKKVSEMAQIKDSLGLVEEELFEGIYFRFVKETQGQEVQKGDWVKVHYSAAMMNGKEIDNNFNSDPFEYQIGKPDQVIPGFAIGMSKMRVGSEALFVIPSDLGFGDKGSSSGIVAPGSMLIYTVRLDEIQAQ